MTIIPHKPVLKIEADLIISALNVLTKGIYSPDKLDIKAYLNSRVSTEVLDFVKFYLETHNDGFADFCKLQNDELAHVLRKMVAYLENLEVVKLELPCEFDSSVISQIHSRLTEMTTSIVLDVSYNEDIIGGLTITRAGKYYDYSVKSAVYKSFYNEKKELLVNI